MCMGTEVLVGRTSGYGVSKREKWWWNREMQESVKRKSKAFKDWKVKQAPGAEEQYREDERDSRRKEGTTTGRAVEQLNERLGTKEGTNYIYNISNLRIMRRHDLGQLMVIRDRCGNMLHKEDDNKMRWRKYYQQLLNTENEKEELGEAQRVEGTGMEIQKQALSKMKNGKEPGSSKFQIEMVKILATERGE
ncbi:uncharacterized protein [Palaemon carinicauda]|uniref:uncharacterized protein n=1 Tax=Palaemon carinicauda TaxID=392227 RepID=UPI0035B63066